MRNPQIAKEADEKTFLSISHSYDSLPFSLNQCDRGVEMDCGGHKALFPAVVIGDEDAFTLC